jgi:hypothetical protein
VAVADREPVDPQAAVDFILKNAPVYAKAKAERVYFEHFRKSKKALLMRDAEVAGAKTSAAQETIAYADPSYQQLLEVLRDATYREENAKWKLTAAQAQVEIWRTDSANNRNQDRSTR